MRWRGRANRSATPRAEHPPAGLVAASPPVAPAEPAPLDVRDEHAERLRRGVASLVITEHREELHRLNGDIDRLSASTTRTGSLVGELAADLGREFDRLRAASAAWAQAPGAPMVEVPGPSPVAPTAAAPDGDGERQTA